MDKDKNRQQHVAARITAEANRPELITKLERGRAIADKMIGSLDAGASGEDILYAVIILMVGAACQDVFEDVNSGLNSLHDIAEHVVPIIVDEPSRAMH